jgi:hypothetical protein
MIALEDEKWSLLPLRRVYLYAYDIGDGMYVFNFLALDLDIKSITRNMLVAPLPITVTSKRVVRCLVKSCLHL